MFLMNPICGTFLAIQSNAMDAKASQMHGHESETNHTMQSSGGDDGLDLYFYNAPESGECFIGMGSS